MNIAPNLRRVLAAERRFEVKWFHVTTVAVLVSVFIAYLFVVAVIDSDRAWRESQTRVEYTLCDPESGFFTDCVDPKGEGITINGTRYFACDVVESTPCFTYRVAGMDTLTYTISR